MAGGGEQLDDRSAVLPAEQPDSRSTWTPRRPVRRALIAAYLLTLAALATVGWIDALNGGARQSDPTGTLWVALLIVTLVQVAQQGYQWALHSAPATAGRTPTRRTGCRLLLRLLHPGQRRHRTAGRGPLSASRPVPGQHQPDGVVGHRHDCRLPDVDAAQYCDRVDGAGSRQPVCHRR